MLREGYEWLVGKCWDGVRCFSGYACLYLLFIVVFITSFICNKMWRKVTYVTMVVCVCQELGGEGERWTLWWQCFCCYIYNSVTYGIMRALNRYNRWWFLEGVWRCFGSRCGKHDIWCLSDFELWWVLVEKKYVFGEVVVFWNQYLN